MSGITVDLMTFECDFINNSNGYSIVINDNGRVAYAYLLNNDGQIVADVWLYNRCPDPIEPEWRDREKIPFANPAEFSRENVDIAFFSECSDISVEWFENELIGARINTKGIFFALLIEGSKPGWSYLAKKDGPLAKVLEVK